ENAGEGIVRSDDEVVFAFRGKVIETGADVEHAPGFQAFHEGRPLGGVVSQSHLHEVAAGCEHAGPRAPDVPAEGWPRRPGRGGSGSRAAPAGSRCGRSRTTAPGAARREAARSTR